MRRGELLRRGLQYHWRAHLGVVLGALVAATVLVGALVVGDSVRHTLRRSAFLRVGEVDAVLAPGDRTFRESLAEELGVDGIACAPVLALTGVVSTADAGRRVADAGLFGVDERFLALGPEPGRAAAVEPPAPGEVLLGEELARRLGAAAGDQLVVRVQAPSALPRDMVLATKEDATLALRVDVAGVLADDDFGAFGLVASPLPPASLFCDLGWLQARLEVPDRANLLLAGGPEGGPETVATLDARLRERWTLADAQLALRELPGGGHELVTERVFLDEPILATVEDSGRPALAIVTYFVNSLEVGDRATPYSMVSGVGPLGTSPPAGEWQTVVPAGDGGVVLNRWLADDLGAGPGDALSLVYFVIGPDDRLLEETRELVVSSVVPLVGFAADPELMPPFPGLKDAESCRDWDPGIPVDLARLRDQDQTYWDDHRGTPKAFVTLAAGRDMWGSRFGSVTGVRFADAARAELEAELLRELDPAAIGLSFRDLRTPAERSANSPTDFGSLFVALSFFLILAAVILTALLFAFGVEQRASEAGLLLALGFRRRQVRGLFLFEGLVLASLGAALGTFLATLYTRLVLNGLATVWRDAVASTPLVYHAEAFTLLGGWAATVVVALAAILLALRRPLRLEVDALLAGRVALEAGAAGLTPARRRLALVLLVVALGSAVALVLLADTGSPAAAAGAFFGAGGLVLLAGLIVGRLVLERLGQVTSRGIGSVAALGVRNGTRRVGRSMATLVVMGIGTFLVAAVGANRLGPTRDAARRDSGTGGFALIGRSSLPVLFDLNTERGREAYGLDEEELDGVDVVALRVRDGDDASCLNLGRPQNPRLVGVEPGELARRAAFRFVEGEGWAQLSDARGDAVPAVGDATSLRWTLKKAIGDTIAYEDERGRTFDIVIVGAVEDSILQGDLVIAEAHFEERFPSSSGRRAFLIDAPAERTDEVSRSLSRALEDVGMSLTPAAQRLDDYHAVQNAYLSIFQVLGALGLLLGTAGLGVVCLRNSLERRGELALSRALGFAPRAIRWSAFCEYGLLLVLGLAAGAAAALVAVLPAAQVSGASGIVGNALVLVALVTVSGVFWIWLSTALAVRGAPIEALRGE